ncbi:cbb3-type cytochrome oxidase assembly protein CcoS [Pedobacter sp. HMWF019]|uniref:cbb3-type cytochrome oxidase assembly protein CcoS n=1 Tax=Pedobacter sp. HMWF019 TaxID=2056856 RepID=UPI000D3A1B22|nr:cbb3-type cytochrome oxidase assembly protein CcoS [Pedobacter sp. HMWF019]PTS94914.1 cbb3-type cytochrome oxidase assembly protein CcoS [Pedobacter sp. HMWF019]
MNMIYMLIGISILLALIFLLAFFWASKTGQNDDTYTPSIRMLFEEEATEKADQKSDEDHL